MVHVSLKELHTAHKEECTGKEMDWETMKKEDNGELAPETLLTSEEITSAA